jgi:thioredoxin reductase (NADPH)
VGLNGAEHIESIVLNENEAERTIPTDYFIPFWSYIKLGPIETGVRN